MSGAASFRSPKAAASLKRAKAPKQNQPRERSSAPDNPSLGRPRILSGGKRVNVYLDAATLERAANLGSGNVSEGIRIALERATGR